MSKLVVVAGQENIDDVCYSQAHTCTVQGHLKEFSHAHPSPSPPEKIPGIFPRAHLCLLVNTPHPSPSYGIPGEIGFPTLKPVPSFGKQPLPLPSRRNSSTPPPPYGIPGKIAFSTLTPAPSFGKHPLPSPQTKFQEN